MDLEIHDVPTELRPQFTQRLKTYKKELDRLRKEFVRQRMLPHDLSFDSSPPVLINVISLIIFCVFSVSLKWLSVMMECEGSCSEGKSCIHQRIRSVIP